ncbi:hypothetical protein V501_09356, partial [Pseudogymnoascus sp. VKM F-4519 (FW-2642)]
LKGRVSALSLVHPRQSAFMIVNGILIFTPAALTSPLLATMGLATMGFGSSGPVAGSVAAWLQTQLGVVEAVMKRCATCTKGKRVILKSHFHISTQELCDAVLEAENATRKQSRKKVKAKGKHAFSGDEIQEYVEEEAEEQFESNI